MLADLKKNLEADEVKERMNRDLKESVKRNKNLTDTKRQVEEQLKAKEEMYQSLLAVKKKGDTLFKEKQKQLKRQQARLRISLPWRGLCWTWRRSSSWPSWS